MAKQQNEALVALNMTPIFQPEHLQEFLVGAIFHKLPLLHEALLRKGAQYDSNAAQIAAESDDMTTLRHCIDLGITMTDRTFAAVAEHNRRDILEKMIPHAEHSDVSLWDVYLCYGAASAGHLELLQWAHKQGFCMASAKTAAASRGHLECLKYIHNVEPSWGFEVYLYTRDERIKSFLHDHDYPGEHVDKREGWGCSKGECRFCEDRKSVIRNVWQMESQVYDNAFQWLPSEVAEDLLPLLENRI
jgi:hypothetical protein